MDMKTKFSDDLTLESEFEDLPPEDFLYDRRGPWPQPSPNHPFGEAPGVLHIPWQEWLYWWFKIGSRYVIVWLLGWPFALLKALMWWKVSPVSDEEFAGYFYNSCYAKFLTSEFTDQTKSLFSDYMEEGKTYFYADFVGMKVLKPISNVKCEASITLFEKTEDGIKPIAMNLRDYICDPSDGDLWTLGKFIALQAAANHIIVATHPRLHFPMDSINAITKTAVPKAHILFQLIHPHTELTLKLDWQVLNSKLSLLENKWWMLYAPFPATAKTMRDLVVLGYHGIKGNPAYPKYFFPLKGPQHVNSPYGKFHDQYYKVFFKFAKNVLSELPEDDKFVTRWMDYIHNEDKTFPNSLMAKDDKDIFYHAVASYIWDVSLGHAADHKTYAEIPLNKNPLRVRVSSPEYKNPDFKLNLNKVATILDQTRLVLANWLFFKPYNVSNLIDAQYDFHLPILKDHVETFKNDLRETEKNLKTMNYMPVAEIPVSIQY